MNESNQNESNEEKILVEVDNSLITLEKYNEISVEPRCTYRESILEEDSLSYL